MMCPYCSKVMSNEGNHHLKKMMRQLEGKYKHLKINCSSQIDKTLKTVRRRNSPLNVPHCHFKDTTDSQTEKAVFLPAVRISDSTPPPLGRDVRYG